MDEKDEPLGWYCDGPAGSIVVWERSRIEPSIAAHAVEHGHDADDYTATPFYARPDGEVKRLRALIAKHAAALRLLHDAHEAMRPFVLNAELVRDALRDFEREVK